MKKVLFIIYIFLFFTPQIYAQELHHQMLSAQGTSTELQSGFYVSQTIGQQGNVGNSTTNDFSIIQGFQQSAWAKLIQSSTLPKLRTISVYPNAFTEIVNIEFSAGLQGEVQVLVFNLSGQLVANRKTSITNNLVTLELGFLPRGMYLVRLTGSNLNYYTKIIKN